MSADERVTPEPPWFSDPPDPGAGITTPPAGEIPSGRRPLTRQELLDGIDKTERTIRLINSQRDSLQTIRTALNIAMMGNDRLLAQTIAIRDVLRADLDSPGDSGGDPQ